MHGFRTESRSFRQPVTPTSPLFLAFTHGEDKDLLELERQRAADALNLSLSCTSHHFFFFKIKEFGLLLLKNEHGRHGEDGMHPLFLRRT